MKISIQIAPDTIRSKDIAMSLDEPHYGEFICVCDQFREDLYV